MPDADNPTWSPAFRTALYAMLGVGAVALVAVTLEVLCLLFGGVVLGVFFTESSHAVARRLHIPRKVALSGIIVGFLAAVAGLALVLVPQTLSQVEALARQLPAYLRTVRNAVEGSIANSALAAAERSLRSITDGGNLLEQGSALFTHLAGILSNGAGAVGALIVVLAIGLYLAFEPQLYRGGLRALVPADKHGLLENVLDQTGHAIAWWFVGQMLSMVVLGSAMTVGLWLIGIPFALVFGLFTALMTFIPNLGPIIAAVPILLVALTQGLQPTLYAVVLIAIVQNVEGLLLTPLVHRRLIALPPAMVLATLLLLGSLAGLLGAIIAMPLVVTVLAIAKTLLNHGAGSEATTAEADST